MRSRPWIVALGAGTVLLAGWSGMAQDEPKATGVVAYRQAAMKANGDHMTAIKTVLSEYPQLMSDVHYHAEALAEATEYTPSWFPEGSDQQPTAALPKIWEDEAGFKAAAKRAQDLAGKLAEAAQGSDPKATLAAFADLGKNGCGGCHQDFRKKQEN